MRTAFVAAISVVGLALGMAQPAQAVTQNRLVSLLGADSCKLSVPTIDSKVRPRATGFRNEGTANVFVICTISTDNGPGGTFGTAPFVDAGLLATSLDGVAHDVQCTGVNSFNIMGDQQFVTKTQNTGTTYTQYWWTEGDFGVSDGSGIPSTGVFSITCILPPNVSLDLVLANMAEDVGA